jgi:hypothetical protein
MKKKYILIIYLLLFYNFILGQNYDTIYFKKNKIEITDTNFVSQLDLLLKNSNICKGYKNYNTYSIQICKIDTTNKFGKYAYLFPQNIDTTDTTNTIYEAIITMVSIGKWQSKSKGYFYINKSLFFIDGDFPDNFANTTKSKKRFFYKIPKPNKKGLILLDSSNEEFCLLVLHLKNGEWKFIEERQNY